MNSSSTRLANLLGALSVGLADEIQAATVHFAPAGALTPSALTTIGHEAGLSIDTLARILQRSHAGTVRLVDRLSAAGLVERRPTADGRAVALHLTPKGKKRRQALLASRSGVIDPLLAALSRADRVHLERIVEDLLLTLRHNDLHAYAICRLCDDQACTRCPMGTPESAPLR